MYLVVAAEQRYDYRSPAGSIRMDAAYVFTVTFEIDPRSGSGDPAPPTVEPNRFETTLELPAAEPGEAGWLRFRNRLWRGEVGDDPSMRAFLSDRLGVGVVRVSFRELRTDEAYLSALRAAIDEDLGRFNADDVDDVLHTYFGSSIHVRA